MGLLPGPQKVKRKALEYKYNLKKEIHLHKCLLHHYDVIDFTLFEFGFRVMYLSYRLLITLLLPVMVISLEDELTKTSYDATPYAAFAYFHLWLYVLLTIQAAVEVAALAWAMAKYPTCKLVRVWWLPWYFKVSWVIHNMSFANVMATALMYKIVFGMDEILQTDQYLFLVVTIYAGIHCAVTGVPIRIAHFLHPVMLLVVYIFFTAFYQALGGTDPKAHGYVYKQMDWTNKLESILTALLWIMATAFFHVISAFASFVRRRIYRRLRKGKEAVMNPDPDDDSSLCSVDQDGFNEDLGVQSPRIWIEDVPNDPHGHKRVIVESPPPVRQAQPTNVYHEVLRKPYLLRPGEKPRRLILEHPDAHRLCFSPTGKAYPRPSQPAEHEHGFPPHAGEETAFICHPEMSPDGKSFLYTCMPEPSRVGRQCYSCDQDKIVDRAELKAKNPWDAKPNSKPQSKAFSFQLRSFNPPLAQSNAQEVKNPKPFVCPRNDYEDPQLVPPSRPSVSNLKAHKKSSALPPPKQSTTTSKVSDAEEDSEGEVETEKMNKDKKKRISISITPTTNIKKT